VDRHTLIECIDSSVSTYMQNRRDPSTSLTRLGSMDPSELGTLVNSTGSQPPSPLLHLATPLVPFISHILNRRYWPSGTAAVNDV
jgi:hypothetical protein